MSALDRLSSGRELFEDLAEERCAVEPSVTRAMMMGFPCLRVGGVFFASFDHRTGDLVVKLPTERADELVDAGEGVPFTPNDRSMRQWVALESRDPERLRDLLAEAEASGRPPAPAGGAL